ncbi:MAG: GNAT family protein [Gallionella sp.]
MFFRLRGMVSSVRKPELTDVDNLKKWLASPDFGTYLGGITGESDQYYENLVGVMLNENADEYSLTKHYIIEDLFTERAIGLWTLSRIDWKNKNLQSSYIIGEKQFRGSLVAGDVNIVMINYIFEELNIHKIYSYTYDNNQVAQRMNNFGGTHDAILKAHKYINGIAVDVHVHSLTRGAFDEFVRKHATGVLRRHIQAKFLRSR